MLLICLFCFQWAAYCAVLMPAYLVVQVIMSLSWQLKQLDEQGKYKHVSHGGLLNPNEMHKLEI